MTRVLICDDSPFMRQMIHDLVSLEPTFTVVGFAKNGQEAVLQANALKPDLITMDVEMPQMDGLTALEKIMAESPTRVVMVSTLTAKGADATMKALNLGAVDFFAKPANGAIAAFRAAQHELLRILKSAAQATVRTLRPAARRLGEAPKTDHVVMIASSTGGPRALHVLFESLPKGFQAPVLIVQHMPQGFTAPLAKRLSGLGSMPVVEGKAGMAIEPGVAIIAPGGVHMVVSDRGFIELNEDAFLHGVRPCADFLFQSAAKRFGAKCIGAVLTGMGKDGAEGAVAVRKSGGVVFGEREATCTVYGMPRAALAAGGIDAEFAIEDMATAIVGALGRRKVARAS